MHRNKLSGYVQELKELILAITAIPKSVDFVVKMSHHDHTKWRATLPLRDFYGNHKDVFERINEAIRENTSTIMRRLGKSCHLHLNNIDSFYRDFPLSMGLDPVVCEEDIMYMKNCNDDKDNNEIKYTGGKYIKQTSDYVSKKFYDLLKT